MYKHISHVHVQTVSVISWEGLGDKANIMKFVSYFQLGVHILFIVQTLSEGALATTVVQSVALPNLQVLLPFSAACREHILQQDLQQLQ